MTLPDKLYESQVIYANKAFAVVQHAVKLVKCV